MGGLNGVWGAGRWSDLLVFKSQSGCIHSSKYLLGIYYILDLRDTGVDKKKKKTTTLYLHEVWTWAEIWGAVNMKQINKINTSSDETFDAEKDSEEAEYDNGRCYFRQVAWGKSL